MTDVTDCPIYTVRARACVTGITGAPVTSVTRVADVRERRGMLAPKTDEAAIHTET
jgi:hypothetical protein